MLPPSAYRLVARRGQAGCSHASDVYPIGDRVAPVIEWLLVARCVQGVGEACSIITSAIIRDVVDDPQERMRIQAYFTTMRPLMLLGSTAATPSPPFLFPHTPPPPSPDPPRSTPWRQAGRASAASWAPPLAGAT